MNVQEGLRRINLLSSRIIWYGATVGFALWLIAEIPLALAGRGSVGLGELVPLLGLPVLVGGVVRVFAWILEGFVLPSSADKSDTA